MSKVFGAAYAQAYDPLYRDKDYVGESNLIATLLRRYGDDNTSIVLDLGSGTGNHAFALAKMGYEVVGVEQSESMLSVARSKLTGVCDHRNPLFRHGDIRTVRLERRFDAALMMFAVLGYQIENSDVLAALNNARAHLEHSGVFVFDVWYGPAVVHEGPKQRVKVLPVPHGKILRTAAGQLDLARHVCNVQYHMWWFAGDKVLQETEETHSMRYFFPMELQLLFESTGFKLIRLGCFPDFDSDPDATTWNVLGVARAV
jgi:SAM-dependent methyltransferase